MENEKERQEVIKLLYVRKNLIDAYNSVCCHCVNPKRQKELLKEIVNLCEINEYKLMCAQTDKISNTRIIYLKGEKI